MNLFQGSSSELSRRKLRNAVDQWRADTGIAHFIAGVAARGRQWWHSVRPSSSGPVLRPKFAEGLESRTLLSSDISGTSAKLIHVVNPVLPDGVYTIDTDGTGPNAPFDAYADMTTAGGGWTLALASATGSEPASNDIASNSGPTTPSLTVGHTRNLNLFAIQNAAEIRMKIVASDGRVLHAKFTGTYHGTLPTIGSWTTLPGHNDTSFSLLSGNLGQPWTTSGSLGTAWWYNGTATYGTTPSFPSDGLTQGPKNSAGATITSFQIFVREQTSAPVDVTPPKVLAVAANGDAITAGKKLASPASSLVVQFNEDMSVTGTKSVTLSANWQLTRNGVDVSSQISGISFGFNAATSTYDATLALTAALSPGNYVLTAKQTLRDLWGNQLDGDANGTAGDDFARSFSVDGLSLAGAEFRANTNTVSAQQFTNGSNRNVAALTGGGYVVTWISYGGQDGSGAGVYAQRYSAAGAPQGSEFLVNTTIANDQIYPSATGLSDGGFLLTWSSFNGAANYDVYAKRYNASGVATTGEFIVNSVTDNQYRSSAVSLSDGSFVVVWSDATGQDGSSSGIYAQRYSSATVALGSAFRVNTTAANDQDYANLAALSGGGFVVTWQSNLQDGSGYGVYAQRYDNAGNALGGEVRVNTTTANNQQGPTIAGLTGGGYVIAWSSFASNGSSLGIFAQRYDAAGIALGGEFQLNAAVANSHQYSALAPLTGGGFVATWNAVGDGSNFGIYQRQFDASGNPLSGDVRVNTFTANNQLDPSIASLADGGAVIVWQSDGEDGDQTGVYGQRFIVSAAPTVVFTQNGNADIIDPGEHVGTDTSSFTLSFSEELSVAGGATGSGSVTNPANWSLTRNGVDVSSRITGITFGLGAASGRYDGVVTLNGTLSSGSYVLTAKSTVTDLAGNAIDGDGNGVGGDAYALAFSIDPLAVVSTSPSLNGGLISGANSFTITFNRPVTNAAAGSFQLRSTGADGLLGTADDPLVALTASASANVATLTFATVANDIYRLTVRDVITTSSGDALDGDGNGSPGGDYIKDFVVGAFAVPLTSPGGLKFDPISGGVGAGSLAEGSSSAFDGLNRLQVGAANYSPTVPQTPFVDVTEGVGTTSVTLTNGYVDLPGASATFTNDGVSPVRVSASMLMRNNSSSYVFAVAHLVVDGVAQAKQFELDLAPNAPFQSLVFEDSLTLPAGQHTIKLQAAAPSGPGAIQVVGAAGQPYTTLRVTKYNPTQAPTLNNGGRTLSTASQVLSGLTVSREITVPSTGSQDFARTVDTFTNPTSSPITSTVRIVGNLGSDAQTTVFATSDGDAIVEPTDLWFATDDGDGTGSPAVVHILHGTAGLAPTAVSVTQDNVDWSYNLTVPAGQTVRLGMFTVLATTRAAAIAEANALVMPSGFGGQAAAFLSAAEISSLANFQFNTAPTTTGIAAVSVLEDAPDSVIDLWAAFADDITPDNALTYSIVSNTNAGLFAATAINTATGKLTLDYAADANGVANLTVRATDAGGLFVDAPFTVTVAPVNDAPAFLAGPAVTVLEDAGAQVRTGGATFFFVGPPNESGQTYSYAVGNSNSALFQVQPAINLAGTLTFTPASNANGVATVTIFMQDNGGNANGGFDTSSPQTFDINVTPVNDPPSFTAGSDQTVNEDGAAQEISAWATNISRGPTNESGQTVTFATSNDNNSLFSIQPSIAADGTLTYTPAANANGSATVTVTLSDNGGTANGGSNASAAKTFTITINPVDDPPTIIPDERSILEDHSITVSFAELFANDSDIDGDAFTVTDAYAAGPGTVTRTATDLTFTPATNFNGDAHVQLVLNAGPQIGVGEVLTIHVAPVNDAPSFTGNGSIGISEDAGFSATPAWAYDLSAGPYDEGGQALDFVVTNDNNALFSQQPAIAADGTLTFTPAANAFGLVNVSVRLHDDGGTANGGADTSALYPFQISISPANDPPTFTSAGDVLVNEDSGLTQLPGWASNISSGPFENDSVYFELSNDNNGLFDVQPEISTDGTLKFSTLSNVNGTATVSVTLRDTGGTAAGGHDTSATQNFTITVGLQNDPPVADDQVIQAIEDTPTEIALSATDPDGDSLTYSIVDAPSGGTLEETQPGVYRYEPNLNFNGVDSFTYLVNDGSLDSNTATVTIQVSAANDAPTAATPPVTQTVEDTSAVITVGGSDVDGDAITYIVVTPPSHGSLTELSAAGSYTYTPAADYFGEDAFTFKADDGHAQSAAATASITVKPVNDAPTIDAVADRTAVTGVTRTVTITGLSVGPANEATSQHLSVTASSDNESISGVPSIALNSDGTATLTYTAGRAGLAHITITATDGGGTANAGDVNQVTRVFTLNVASGVVDRHLFYNNSHFDGGDAGFSNADDAAVATDKSALLPGDLGTSVNVSSYDKGINGVMIDVAGLPTGKTITADDLSAEIFLADNWVAAPAPASVSLRAAVGTNSADRITIIWPDGSIKNTWLRVTLKPTANTGLALPDVSYWGSAVADTGNALATDTTVNIDSADYYGVRDHLRSYANLAPVTWNWDINRDGVTDITDMMLVRSSATTSSTALMLITAPQTPAPVQSTGTGVTNKLVDKTTSSAVTTTTASSSNISARPAVKPSPGRIRISGRGLVGWGRK